MASKIKRSHLEVGDVVLNGKYEITKVVHTSGMSNVYLVLDNSLNKVWCLKEIKKSESGKNKVEYHSLLQEANIMKGLNHASIPRIVTIEEDGDSLFIVMDYVEGVSIKNWIQKKQRIKQDVVVTWMRQICQVMIYLHNRPQPIFYRDMKPDNIMIQSDGNIKVIDFGISIVIKEPGQLIARALGTKGYAAPEQSKSGLPCDLRSDIYGIGMTMYYMLTGLNPSRIPREKLRSIRDIDSSISMGIDKIVEKCIQENPDNRYQSCEELLYDLQNYEILDTEHRTKARRKVNSVLALYFVSAFILVTSCIPLFMEKRQKSDEYNNLLEVAYQSNKVSDYELAIAENPTNLEPYTSYIDAIKTDGVFSKEEEEGLLGIMNPNLSLLKESSKFGNVSYEIGRLYWFYYEEDGDILSVKWFKDALDSGYETEMSEIYYNLGLFKRDISMSIAESSDSGMYKSYWENLVKARSKSSDELTTLQLNQGLAECISSYGYRLNTDGILKEDVLAQVTDIRNYMSTFQTDSERTQELFNSLTTSMQDIETKVEASYAEVVQHPQEGTESGTEQGEVQLENQENQDSQSNDPVEPLTDNPDSDIMLDDDLGGGF